MVIPQKKESIHSNSSTWPCRTNTQFYNPESLQRSLQTLGNSLLRSNPSSRQQKKGNSLLRPRVLSQGLSAFSLPSKVLPGGPLPPFCLFAMLDVGSLFVCAVRHYTCNLLVATSVMNGRSVSFHFRLLTDGRTVRLPKQH